MEYIKERMIKNMPLIKPIMEINNKEINLKSYSIKIRKGWNYGL